MTKPAPKPTKSRKPAVPKAAPKPITLKTREQWLHAFTKRSAKHFKAAGFPLPENLRLSIGFCSSGARGKAIGECWSSKASEDAHFEIFIDPTLQSESSRVADILTHELCHAATPGEKHGPVFKRCAVAMGLVGKMTATTAGEGWHKWADPILTKIGPMPGANLKQMERPTKKQATRLLKAECEECGLIFRITAKYADKVLNCPDVDCCGAVHVTRPAGGGEDE